VFNGALADVVPGVFTFLGIHNESAGSVHNLHTSRFVMDESQLPLGAALHASMALDFLNSHSGSSASHTEL
jgi:IAA-amino acid hydrolase